MVTDHCIQQGQCKLLPRKYARRLRLMWCSPSTRSPRPSRSSVMKSRWSSSWDVDDGPLMARVKKTLQKARRLNESSEFKMYPKSRFHLFAEIGSPQWTGCARIRAQTSQILSLHGFGHKDSVHRFGEGDPPVGLKKH